MIRRLNPVLEHFLKEALVKTTKKGPFDTSGFESDKDILGRIEPELEPKWNAVPGSRTPVPSVSVTGEVVPELPKVPFESPTQELSKASAIKKAVPHLGRFGAQMGIANLTPFGEAGEKAMEAMGVESPWGQYWGGWATAGVATDLSYPLLTTTPKLIAQGAKVGPALTTGGAQGLAALTHPLNLAITLAPLAVWGAIEGAEKVEEYIDTKDMTPTQKDAYYALKREKAIKQAYEDWKKEKKESEEKAKKSQEYNISDIPPGR